MLRFNIRHGRRKFQQNCDPSTTESISLTRKWLHGKHHEVDKIHYILARLKLTENGLNFNVVQ